MQWSDGRRRGERRGLSALAYHSTRERKVSEREKKEYGPYLLVEKALGLRG